MPAKKPTAPKSGVPEAKQGLPVYWYPHALRDKDTVPLLGFIVKPWSQGVADLNILPSNSGAVEKKPQVYHATDKRLVDHNGKPTPNAWNNGCWEYTEMSKAYLDSLPSKEAEA